MPSRKSKEDTWKESELLDAIQGQEKKKKSSSKSSKSGESSRHGTRDDKEKHRRSEASGSHRKDSDRKEKDRDREREKERVREREPVDGHEGSRQKPKEDGKRSHKEEKEKSSRRKDEKLRTESEDGRSRTKERERSDGKDKERRRDKEDAREKEKRDADKKGRREKDRDGSERKERKDREKDGDDGKERRREKDGEGSRSRHKEDGESKRKHHKSKREDKEREDSRESSKHRSSSSSKDGKSSKDRKDRHKEKKEKRKDESEVRYHENEPREDMGRTERSKERKSRDLPSVDENEPQESRQNDRKTEKDNPTAGHGPKFRKASIDKQNSYEEEIEDQSRRKASIARRKSSILNSDEVNEEVIDDNAYDYGDDDFEDYDDDDFEEDDGDEDEGGDELNFTNEELEGVDEIRKAMREENQLAESHNSSRSSSRPSTRDGVQGRLGTSSSTSVAKTQPRGKINFIAAKQKQISDKVASKTRRRGKELSKLIELDVVAMDLFELQPLNIYEVYMKSFGRTNTEQVAVQTNEDCLEQETQTEEIEAEAKWCQFSNEVQSFGGENENSSKANTTQSSTMSHDTKRLNKFLSKATQLCMTLLNEMADNEDKISDRYEQSEMKFSERFLKLDLKSQLTNGRQFVNTHTSNANLFLTAHGKSSLENSTISPDGVICVWKLNNSTEPQMYLSCGSTPKCCCFSPRKPSFAFAGMEDGSVSVWDLREPSSLHNRKKLGEKEIVLRSETFSTASVYGDDSHSSSVVSIEAIAPPEESSASDGNSSDSIAAETGGTLQLASLEENGTINIWVVIEMFSPDPGGSQQDLGLLPGGKVKLVKSGSITLQLPRRLIDPSQKIAFIGTVLHVEPNHGKSLYIGTEQGVVLHSSRFGDKVTPKAFYISDKDTPRMVSCIDHAYWKMPYMLIGCTDGSIALLNTEKEYPITTWETFGQGAGILRVKWLHNKPSVFCTLDKNSVFCVWDLLKSDASPIFKETLRKSSKAKSLDFSLLGDSSDKKQQVVVFFDDNTAEIHKLAKSLCGNSNSDTNEILSRFEDIS
ncbi:cytoplasmic dynein 2 intermediate chain 1-like isoform X2 [Rhopilema esculentum]|uniref:cytoplasmic dynein 2 intermediate chain 1-like isoform X2 n=1 Tax=Rhopilema esculentum TaxID=499914 RepID=UPI0031D31EB1